MWCRHTNNRRGVWRDHASLRTNWKVSRRAGAFDCPHALPSLRAAVIYLRGWQRRASVAIMHTCGPAVLATIFRRATSTATPSSLVSLAMPHDRFVCHTSRMSGAVAPRWLSNVGSHVEFATEYQGGERCIWACFTYKVGMLKMALSCLSPRTLVQADFIICQSGYLASHVCPRTQGLCALSNNFNPRCRYLYV